MPGPCRRTEWAGALPGAPTPVKTSTATRSNTPLPTARRQFKDLLNFKAGQHYEVKSQSAVVIRPWEKTNLYGDLEETELSGRTLVLCIEDQPFVDGRFLEKETEIRLASKVEPLALQTLVDHFAVPDRPSLSTVYQHEYERNRVGLMALIDALHTTPHLNEPQTLPTGRSGHPNRRPDP